MRECRGTTFDARNGKVIARKFHKFFNIGERLETQPHLIDWARPHVRLVKADGSLMTPLVLGGEVRWSSKMGVTKVSAPVEEFVKEQSGYRRLAHDAAALGVTPQFEWCSSAGQRIILDYPETRLVLLAVRETDAGRYWPQDDVEDFARSYGVPCIERVPGSVTDHVAYRSELAALTGIEGEVVAFGTGERYKAKTAEYLRFHRALAGLAQEKDVLALVLSDGTDDVKPFLAADLAEKLDTFGGAVNHGLDRSAERLGSLFREGYREFAGDRKQFAVELRGPAQGRRTISLRPLAEGRGRRRHRSGLCPGTGCRLRAEEPWLIDQGRTGSPLLRRQRLLDRRNSRSGRVMSPRVMAGGGRP